MTNAADQTAYSDPKAQIRRERMMRRATYAAVAVALVLAAVKAAAFLITGSIALFGSLVDTVVDLIASCMILIAVRHALEPPDREHRFGHGKAEALAGIAQFAVILLSCAYLITEAVSRLFVPEPVQQSLLGIAVIAGSLTASLGLVLYQRHVARQTGSVAIAADSIHYTNDFLLNGGVILALVLSGLFGWTIADPIIGIGIGLWVAYAALEIFRRSYDQLMDREFDEADREKIKDLVLAHPEVHGLHDLRTRRSGAYSFIQFHLELDAEMTLRRAHEIADAVERKVEAAFPGADCIAHQEPKGEFIESELALT